MANDHKREGGTHCVFGYKRSDLFMTKTGAITKSEKLVDAVEEDFLIFNQISLKRSLKLGSSLKTENVTTC